jgi:hypothetical protein
MSNAAPSTVDYQAGDRTRCPTPRAGVDLKQTWKDFSEDNAMRLAAAMACYVMLALAPMIVVAFKSACKRRVAGRTSEIIRHKRNS